MGGTRISGSLRKHHRQPPGKGSRSLTGQPRQTSMSSEVPTEMSKCAGNTAEDPGTGSTHPPFSPCALQACMCLFDHPSKK